MRALRWTLCGEQFAQRLDAAGGGAGLLIEDVLGACAHAAAAAGS